MDTPTSTATIAHYEAGGASVVVLPNGYLPYWSLMQAANLLLAEPALGDALCARPIPLQRPGRRLARARLSPSRDRPTSREGPIGSARSAASSPTTPTPTPRRAASATRARTRRGPDARDDERRAGTRRAGASRARCRRPVRARALAGAFAADLLAASRAEPRPDPGAGAHRRGGTLRRRDARPSALPGLRAASGTWCDSSPGTDARERSPPATVAIVNWNGRHLLESCLPLSLRPRLPARRRSSAWSSTTARADGSLEWLAREWPAVRVVAHADNRGLRRGRQRRRRGRDRRGGRVPQQRLPGGADVAAHADRGSRGDGGGGRGKPSPRLGRRRASTSTARR